MSKLQRIEYEPDHAEPYYKHVDAMTAEDLDRHIKDFRMVAKDHMAQLHKDEQRIAELEQSIALYRRTATVHHQAFRLLNEHADTLRHERIERFGEEEELD